MKQQKNKNKINLNRGVGEGGTLQCLNHLSLFSFLFFDVESFAGIELAPTKNLEKKPRETVQMSQYLKISCTILLKNLDFQ